MTTETKKKNFFLKKQFVVPFTILTFAGIIWLIITIIKPNAAVPKLYNMSFTTTMQQRIFNANQETQGREILMVKFTWSYNKTSGDYKLIATGQYLDAAGNWQEDLTTQVALANQSLFCSNAPTNLNGASITMYRGDIKALNGRPTGTTDVLLPGDCTQNISLTPLCTSGNCSCPAGQIVSCNGSSGVAGVNRPANPCPPKCACINDNCDILQ